MIRRFEGSVSPYGMKIAYLNVHTSEYPRNRLIRSQLQQHGCTVALSKKLESRFFVTKTIVNATRMLRAAWGSDVVVLSEFALRYAPYTWLLSRLTGAVHVVDGFVRLYESRVEDSAEVSPRSWKAAVYRGIDRLSVVFSDVYLVDTKLRAETIKRDSKLKATVLSLPVGAPDWARSSMPVIKSGNVRLLYYGNYIHLHGVDVLVKAFARLPLNLRATLTLVGDGTLRPETEALVDELGIRERCNFVDPVPESELRDLIADHDVIFGIFGLSPKAATVIANKVWQGLACGRLVVTRESLALDELRSLVGSQLQTCPAGDEVALTRTIKDIIRTGLYTLDFSASSLKLNDYVEAEFKPFLSRLSYEVSKRASQSNRRRALRAPGD